MLQPKRICEMSFSMIKGFFTSVVLNGIGEIRIAGTGLGICQIELGRHPSASLPPDTEWVEDASPFQQVISKLKSFAMGKETVFTERLDILRGTLFQRSVWREIGKIKWGEAKSYAEIASLLGRSKAYRAVAKACGANPIPLVIPCHRVIASDGSIGGFSSGVGLKRRFLKLEGTLTP